MISAKLLASRAVSFQAHLTLSIEPASQWMWRRTVSELTLRFFGWRKEIDGLMQLFVHVLSLQEASRVL
jgi:hypothetical protein